MGKRKGNSNETEAAKAVTGALEPVVSEEHGEPAAAPVVDGDGGTAAGIVAPKHAAEPPPPADGPDDGGSSAEEPDGAAAAEAAEGVASEAVHESEGMSDASANGTVTGDAGDALGEGVAEGEGGASGDELGAQPAPDGGSDHGSGVAADGAGNDGSGASGDGHDDDRNRHSPDANHDGREYRSGGGDVDGRQDAGPCGGNNEATSAGWADSGGSGGRNGVLAEGLEEQNHVDDPTLEPSDGAVATAENACFDLLYYFGEYYLVEGDELARLQLLAGEVHSKATNAIAACVRNIGKERATAAVVGQQLKILGIIDNPELSEREELVVSTFISVLTGIDAYDQAVAVRMALADAKPPEPRPLPMDESTMETADDPLATWGG